MPPKRRPSGRCATGGEGAAKRARRTPCKESNIVLGEGTSYADALHEIGVIVVPCINECMLPSLRQEFEETVRNFPEFVDGAEEFIMGGFCALGNPASFHNPFVRKLREWALHTSVNKVWKDYVRKYKQGSKLEQVFDRMMRRPVGKSPTAESWHRDIAFKQREGDEVFGGWINLDSKPQYFNCVLNTHKDHPLSAIFETTNGERKVKKGFATFDKNCSDVERFKKECKSIRINPGHMIIFFEHIVHEVVSKKAKHIMYRLFTGWCLTEHSLPLMANDAQSYRNKIQDMSVMDIKSGQVPAMYATLHWINWRGKIEKFAENLRDVCKESKKLPEKRTAGGQQTDGPTHIVVPHKHMRSLAEYGFREAYPQYTEDEMQVMFPNVRWKNVRKTGTDIKEDLSLH